MWKGNDRICTQGKKVSPNSFHSKSTAWAGLNQACAGLELNTLWHHLTEHSPGETGCSSLGQPWSSPGKEQAGWAGPKCCGAKESNPVAVRVLPAFQHQNCSPEVPSPSSVDQESPGELNTNINIAGKDWVRWDESIAYRMWSWCNPVLLYWFGRQLKAYKNNICIVNGFFRHICHGRSQNLS